MHFAQMRVGHVSVDLGGVDRGVAEELLDRADIGAIAQEVGREGVAKRVGGDHVRDPGPRHVALQVPLDVPWSNPVELIRPPIDKERLLHVFARLEVVTHRLFGSRGEEDDSHLLAFAAYRELVARKVEVSVERTELGDAEPGREEEFEDSAIAQAPKLFLGVALLSERLAGRLEESLELGVGDEVELSLGELGELDLLGANGLDIALPQEFEEGAKRDHVIILRPALHGVSSRPRLAVEPEAEFAHALFGDIAHVTHLHLGKIARQIAVIILDCLHRPPALDLEML